MPETEWLTRKQRIDKRLQALNPAWQIIPYRPGLDISSLTCHAVTEFPTENGPADYGRDLSGTIHGAGGVGGLLFLRDAGSAIGYSAPAFDGNGNVMALVSLSGGTNCATYEYGPFGELLRATGPMAKANPIRWSTKYQDDETDLVYYGARYLKTSTGGWLSRDSLEEKGGLNLYGFVHNEPVSKFDTDGREIGGICPNCGTYYVGECPSCGYPHSPPKPPTPPDPVGFALCMRNVNPEGLGENLLLIGFRILHPQTPTDHAYLHYKHCDKCERVGLGIGGTTPGRPPIPEHKFQPTDCKPCKRTGSNLQYGATTKTGTQATDQEIWDCISKVPTSKKYVPTGKNQYNCLDWAKEAASKCGLDCN